MNPVFFASCGQIWRILQTETQGRLTVVLPLYEWLIQRFDYNKDVSVKDLEARPPLEGISWASRGLLKIKYLGTIFQLYSRAARERWTYKSRGPFSTTEKKNVVKTVEDIIVTPDSDFTSAGRPKNGKTTTRKHHPFITAEEMLFNHRKNTKQDNQTV